MGQSDNRPLKTVLISSIDITVLPDSGATVNAMDSKIRPREKSKDQKVKMPNKTIRGSAA